LFASERVILNVLIQEGGQNEREVQRIHKRDQVYLERLGSGGKRLFLNAYELPKVPKLEMKKEP